jgi:hypothetical protein
VTLFSENGKFMIRRSGSGEAGARVQELYRAAPDALVFGAPTARDESTSANRIVLVRPAEGGAVQYICISGRALRRKDQKD